jgi:hypothetical protein
MNSMGQLALVQVRGGRVADAQATVDAIWSGGYVAQNDHDRRSESLLYRTMGEIALADGRTDDAQRHCRRSVDEVEKFFPEGHPARLQARAGLALANWRVDRNRNARAALLAIKPALAAGGRVAAYWLAKVDAAIAESAG